MVKKLLCLSKYLSDVSHKQGEEAVVSCAHTDAHPAGLCPAKPGTLCSEQIADCSFQPWFTTEKLHTSLNKDADASKSQFSHCVRPNISQGWGICARLGKPQLLPVARKTISQLNKEFDEWGKNLTAADPASPDCSAPCGFWNGEIYYLMPFTHFLLAFGKMPFQIRDVWCGTGPGFGCSPGSARSCAHLSRHHIPLASAAAGNLGMGKQGRRSYLTYRWSCEALKYHFEPPDRACSCSLRLITDTLAVQQQPGGSKGCFFSVQVKHKGWLYLSLHRHWKQLS